MRIAAFVGEGVETTVGDGSVIEFSFIAILAAWMLRPDELKQLLSFTGAVLDSSPVKMMSTH